MRIAAVGDVHEHWGPADIAYFDASDYDLILFVGDLPGPTHRGTLRVARSIATLRTPALVFPGNHDGTSPLQVLAEATRRGHRWHGWVRRQQRGCDALAVALGRVPLCGYSVHPVRANGVAIDVIAARPHAMDSRFLSFAPYMQWRYGVADLDASADRLRRCVDESTADTLIFLAHNGPTGFGASRSDPWSLRRFGRDNGDRDLADAIGYAKEGGRDVLAVVAGHIHRRDGARARRWSEVRDGTLYVNAARVPRVFRDGARTRRHHVRIVVDGTTATAEQVLVDGDGSVSPAPPRARRP